ncbi:transglycosylase domain-containing protein [Dictyobacter vulcani]|uniref:transglycosylase domain-containing protein n=1 Tax=Dictyobacter vulcani TaxID=2607529 RepID=UPI00353103BA
MTAIEDRTFWTNSGINTESILRAAGKQQGGASTITQQVIKNLSHNSQHTFQRKLQEAVLAVGLTHKYTKTQIWIFIYLFKLINDFKMICQFLINFF